MEYQQSAPQLCLRYRAQQARTPWALGPRILKCSPFAECNLATFHFAAFRNPLHPSSGTTCTPKQRERIPCRIFGTCFRAFCSICLDFSRTEWTICYLHTSLLLLFFLALVLSRKNVDKARRVNSRHCLNQGSPRIRDLVETSLFLELHERLAELIDSCRAHWITSPLHASES